jgi:ABC-type branched-subunit amino acid transport system ATPase component
MGDIIPANRRAINKAIRDMPTHETLRQQIDPAHQIERISKALEVLDTNAAMCAIGIETLDQSALISIKTALDTRLKLLDKALPSLKSVELKAEGDGEQRITFIMGRLDE